MDENELLRLLVAEVGIAEGVLAAEDVADLDDALAGLGPEQRQRVEAAAKTRLTEAGGSALNALVTLGIDPNLHARLAPDLSHGLTEAGARVRSRLRRLEAGRYDGLTPLAEGGMGIVYFAVDTELNRRVALKMMRVGKAHPLDPTPTPIPTELEARFLQEAWVTGGLEHPGIVPVYELGRSASGAPYYTMRLIRGARTFADAIDEATTFEQRLGLLEPFLKVCDAIRFAHSRGVVHRDLKPANIALGQFGEAVVLDWGLAKMRERRDLAESSWRQRVEVLREETDLKTLTSALGTPGYMAPEAALGQVANVDARSDVFSLGAILYAILAGRPPFEFDSFAAFVTQVMTQVEDVPGAPPGLGAICRNALAVEREDRFEDAGELAAAIRAWQTESVVEREVATLRAEVHAALEAATDLEGDRLLHQLDRAVALSTRIEELRPNDAATQTLLDRSRRMRTQAAADRERAIVARETAARRRLVRRGAVAGLALAAAAAIVVSILLDQSRRRAESARAETAEALGRERKISQERLELLEANQRLSLQRDEQKDKAEGLKGELDTEQSRVAELIVEMQARKDLMAALRNRTDLPDGARDALAAAGERRIAALQRELKDAEDRLRAKDTREAWADVAEANAKAVFLIVGQWPKEGKVSVCTGFAIRSDGVLATTARIATELEDAPVRVALQNVTGLIFPIERLRAHPSWTAEGGIDLGLIKIRPRDAGELPTMTLASDVSLANLRIGIRLGTIAFSAGRLPEYLSQIDREKQVVPTTMATFKDGWIARITDYKGALATFANARYIQHSASLGDGSPGAPLFGVDGKVVAVGTRDIRDSKGSAEIGHAIRIDELKEFLVQAGW